MAVRTWAQALLVATVLVGLAVPGSAMPVDVVYVTHTPASMTQYTPFLEGIFGVGQVSTTTGTFTNAHNDAGQRATLMAADLIIIGRQTNSGDYDQSGEPEFWNALHTPILLHSVYLVRSSRLSWLEGDIQTVATDSLDILAPNDPILAGVTPVGGSVQIYSSSQSQDISNADGTGTLGTLVATASAGDIAIARWDGSESLYWTGSDEGGPGGQRIFWGTPTSNDWINKLTPDGERMLENAVRILVPEPATLSLLLIGGLGLLARRRKRA